MKKIIITGARQHNLNNIDLELPHRKIIAITGVSGSGKSSLAFDTIYAEGQRRYIESLSTYARQFIEKLDRPDLDSISGISPTIAIRQRNTVTSSRSTVGTATEIYDYLRLLFARIGRTVCPECGLEVRRWSPSEAAGEIVSAFHGKRIFLLVPGEMIDASKWKSRIAYLSSRGFTRLYLGGELFRIEEIDPLHCDGRKADLLLDRLVASETNRTRISEAIETAYRENDGVIEVAEAEGDGTRRFSSAPSCSECGKNFEQLTPILFSFNSPYGACPECKGFGDKMDFSEELIIPDDKKSLRERAVDPWSRERFDHFHNKMMGFCLDNDIPTDIPWRDLSDESRSMIIDGGKAFSGVIPFLERMKEKNYKKGHRFFTRRYMGLSRCRSCHGSRLRKEAGFVRFSGRKISDLAALIPSKILSVLNGHEFTPLEKEVSKDIVYELNSRLGFMIDVGLGYLSLDRLTKTLSGGEAQRINLANSLGANLVDTLYVLDEPSVGMHAADNEKLINVMVKLRDLGNTVLVVEHDPDIIMASDHLVDLGPGPGREGGRVLFNGPISEAAKTPHGESKTLEYLFNIDDVERPVKKAGDRRKSRGEIGLSGISMHNLKDLQVNIPLGNLVAVTGVSGSGKSTLIVDVLYRLLSARSGRPHSNSRQRLELSGKIDRVLLVDQSPIGSSPRSNPVTYIKGFSHIRELFATQRKSILRGYQPGRFSFNKTGGRCSKCQGMGYRRVEMHFMADVFVPCEVCEGRRYNRDTLEVEYKGKNISDVLDMTVDEAIMFFDELPHLGEKLWVLSKTGLGYLKLGQPSNTLSGGEAQRIKIARELTESKGLNNLYIMDEPTTGLHVSDIARLLRILDELVDAGHSVIVIEHNMDLILWSDHIIDMGPGGGEEGGNIVATGTVDLVVKSKGSLTGRYLGEYLSKFRRED
ncbi:MAG: excinuclease ABC subunit UvrA [Candidatus Krumholzibacteriota bacterium]|nr:excinuclease ABC subunit UvrA [Candidatus Krumholzibacteriota bacterium]